MNKLHTTAATATVLACALLVAPATLRAQESSTNTTTVQTASPAAAVDAEALIGRDIRNPQGETIGEVDSVILGHDGKAQLVVAEVGGFLGIGARQVALAWDELDIRDNGEAVVTTMDKEQLAALPEYTKPQDAEGDVYTYNSALSSNPYLADNATSMGTTAQSTGTYGTTATGMLASDLIGTNVENAGGETIGEIEDVILGDAGQVEGVLVDVGGFLNVGERRVLLGWNELQIAANGGEVSATASYTADQLQGLPAYETTSMN